MPLKLGSNTSEVSEQISPGFLKKYEHINWALADQALVSGFNFLTGILLARLLGLAAYGQYVLVYAALLYLNTFQASLVIAPMMSLVPQVMVETERREFLRGLLAFQIIFTSFLGAAVLLLSNVVQWFLPFKSIAEFVWPFLLTLFFFQLQDWLRRFYFIGNAGKKALINDAISYGGQAALLLVLSYYGRLSVPSAFGAIALTSAVAYAVGAFTEGLRPAWPHGLRAFKKCWPSGRDLLIASQLQWAGSQGVLIIGAGMLGVAAAGGIRAAQNIVGPLNILFQAMENFVPVQAARRYAKQNMAGLLQYLKSISVWGGGGLALAGLFFAVTAGWLVPFAYGQSYAAFSALVGWQALYMLLGFFYRQTTYFHRTIGNTSVILAASAISAGSSVLLAFYLTASLRETGLMLALIAGQAIGLAYAVRLAATRSALSHA